MRLVDADVADKWMRQNNSFIDSAILKAIPTIDAVPVVRCQECRYYPTAKVNEKGFLICPASGMEITETDYCSYSEKKIETVLPKSDAKDESFEGEHD